MELLSILKISSQVVFCKKVALKCFLKIYKKTPVPKPATLLKKRLWYRWFPVNFAKFLRTPFFIERLRWLLLNLFQNTYYPNNHYLLCEKSYVFEMRILSLRIFMLTISLIELEVLFALNFFQLLLNRINVYPFSHKRSKYPVTYQIT